MSDGWEDYADDIDELDFPTVHVNLIDALRDYIRCYEDIERDAYAWGEIPPPVDKERDRKFQMHMQHVRLLLKDIVDFDFDPTLGDRVKR